MRVDIWSDIVCPWCYIGKRRFESALAAFDGGSEVEIFHHSFQLDPTAPRVRTSDRREMLMKKYRLDPAQMAASDARMTEVAAEEGLDFHLEGTVSGNTRDAHQLVHLAREQGRQDAMLERLYRAYFTEQRSVFEPESLIALATDIGLNAEEVRMALQAGSYDPAVQDDVDLARRMGISGVPFFVFNAKYGLSGAQQVAVFVEALTKAAAADASAG